MQSLTTYCDLHPGGDGDLDERVVREARDDDALVRVRVMVMGGDVSKYRW